MSARKTLAAAVALALGLSLAACSKTEDGTAASGADTTASKE